MKKLIIFAIIFGVILVVAGAGVAAAGYKYYKVDKMIENTITLDDTYDKMSFKIETANLTIEKSTESTTKIVFTETKKITHEAKIIDNTLTVTVNDTRKWYEKIFNFNDFKIKAIAYIPAAEFESLTVDTATGNVNVPSDFTFENVNLKSSTGNIEFKAIVNDKLEASASTGNITISDSKPQNIVASASTGNINISNVEVVEKIEAKTSTGNISIKDSKATDLYVRLSTGNITLTNYVSSNSMELIASTGNIKFDRVDANTISAKTSTGSIKGTLLTGKTFDAESDTGKVTVPLGTTGGLCKLRTDTGRILIELAE